MKVTSQVPIIIISGAFPDSEKYFNELSQKAFLQIDQFYDKEIFISNGLKDPLDSNKVRTSLDYNNAAMIFQHGVAEERASKIN